MATSDLERYHREQLRMLEDLDWRASEDSLAETLTNKFRAASLSLAIAVELARHLLRSKGLNPEIVERIALRVCDRMGEAAPSN